VSEDNQQHLPWQDGLPTSPDVTMIQKQWPELKVGDRIAYEEIADLVGIKIRSNRFKSVTDAWRKRELEAGKVIECEIGAAFYVASCEQVSAKTYVVLKTIGRKAKRHRRHLSVQRPENDLQRSTVEHQARLMQSVEKDARKARMNLLPSTAVQQPPRIEPPKNAMA
jgi:hypothetical protein